MRCLVILMASVTLLAQPTAHIEGKVVDSAGKPVRGADVRLVRTAGNVLETGQTPHSVLSDDDGKFAFDIDPAPNLALTAQKAGYASARYGAKTRTTPMVILAVKDGEALKDLVLTMTPQGVVSGRVVDEAGDPQDKARVDVLLRVYQERGMQLVPAGSAQTNDLGEFRVALPPGNYYVESSSSPNAFFPGPKGIPTFFGNVTDPLRAKSIAVGAGQEIRGIEIRQHHAQSRAVRGRVIGLDVSGRISVMPVPDALASGVLSPLGAGIAGAILKPDGSFEIRALAPGAYVLEVQGPGSSASLGSVRIDLGDHDVEDVVLQAAPAFRVAGTIRVEEGTFAALFPRSGSAQVAQPTAVTIGNSTSIVLSAGPGPGTLQLAFHRADGSALPSQLTALVAGNGTFSLENVTPGRYVLDRPTIPSGYMRSMRVNDSDVTGMELRFGDSSTLEIVLAQDAAEVSGVMARGVTVALWPEQEAPAFMDRGVRLADTNSNGEFKIAGVAPGTYFAVAFADLERYMAYQRPFITQFASQAVKVEVQADSNVFIEPKLVPLEEAQKAMEKMQ